MMNKLLFVKQMFVFIIFGSQVSVLWVWLYSLTDPYSVLREEVKPLCMPFEGS